MFSDEYLQALREGMPELLALRCGVRDLRRSFRCPSPAHDDRTPSARYYENDHSVHCFGCNRTWDVFSLLGELDGVDGFADQVRAVAELLGVGPEEGGAPARRRRRRPRLRPLFDPPREAGAADCGPACDAAWEAMYGEGNEVARRYLRFRGLDDVDAMRWGLGFTRAPRDVMPQFRVWEPEALGWITIPFWNRDFSVATYCMLRTVSRGQVRNKEWRPAGVATPLWMEWQLSASVDVLCVAEGLIDAMALHKATGMEVMALGGVGNARRLAQVLHATPKALRPRTVMVAMDEDDEGRKASARICADLDALRVPHAVMPPYPGGAKDADEWLCAMRDSEWRFEEYESGGLVMYGTRWL